MPSESIFSGELAFDHRGNRDKDVVSEKLGTHDGAVDRGDWIKERMSRHFPERMQ